MIGESSKRSNDLLNLVLINLVPVFLLIISFLDLLYVLKAPGAYPFGTENSPASIYTSQTRYVVFQSIHIFLLIALVGLSFFRRRFEVAFYVTLVLNLIAFFYPLMTGRD